MKHRLTEHGDIASVVAAAKQGQAPTEFLSAHPSDETRVRKAREGLPEAMEHYKKR